MKSYRKELWFNVPGRRSFINITPQVQECLRESGIQEGLCLVNAMHITASVLINDDESRTLLGFSTLSPEMNGFEPEGDHRRVEEAFAAGKILAEKAVKGGIKSVIFDRGGYRYHGRVKAFAEGAREGGLEF